MTEFKAYVVRCGSKNGYKRNIYNVVKSDSFTLSM